MQTASNGITTVRNWFPYAVLPHSRDMRAALLIFVVATSAASDAFGVWKLNSALSTGGANEKSVTLRVEPHNRGEVLTLDILAADGRASTSSTILYLDGKARDFQDLACSGTQSSRRVDSHTVEILRECAGGRRVRLIRRAENSRVLVLEITEENSDGRRSERRVVLERR